MPAGAGATTVEEAALGIAHVREHEAMARMAAAKTAPPPRMSRARQRALAAQAGEPREVGRWDTPPFPIPNFAIHATLLPTGKILTWGYPPKLLLEVRPNFAQASLWDIRKGTGSESFKDVPPPILGEGGQPASVYCSGQTLLPDGSVLLAGGTRRLASAGQSGTTGLETVFTFDPWSETWSQQPDMRHGRWYPSQVQLADGRAVFVGGYDESEPGNHDTRDVEVFHPPAETGGRGWIELKESASRRTALYPHLFLMPGGDVLLGGPGRGDSAILDTDSFTWSELPAAREDRIGGTAVLRLADEDGPTRVTQIGGYDYTTDEADSPAHNSTETIGFSDPHAGWSDDAPMNIARAYANTVLLPDGSMITLGGDRGRYLNEDRVYADGRARAVELWSPTTGRWTLGPPQQEDRGYHSTAVLLPDGRVFSAGDDRHPNDDSDTAEIYSPPYLFKRARPEVTAAPAAMSWGEQFAVNASADVDQVVLMAPGATTHGADMHQRRVPLRISERVPGQGVNAVSPDGPTIAPPGWYMLFVVGKNGAVSKARWLQLRADAPSPRYFDTDPPHPRLVLKRTSVKKLARRGRVAIKLRAAEAISGRVAVKLRVRTRSGRSFIIRLGNARGLLLAEGERRRRLTFRLSSLQRTQMRRARKVDVLVKAEVRDRANNRGSARLTRTVS